MSLINIPSKEDTEYEDCSMIHLLDENYCIKQSLDLINYNVASLSTRSLEINEFATSWNDTYTLFVQNSADWNKSARDVIRFNADWTASYSTVKELSAKWTVQEFTVYFDRIIRMDSWYSTKTNDTTVDAVSSLYVQKTIPKWLKNNFSPSKYAPNQRINVFLYLSYDNNWEHNFTRSYIENCVPSGSVTYRTYLYAADEKGKYGPVMGDDPCFIDWSNPKAKPAQVHLWEENETGDLGFNCQLCDQPYYQGCNHHGGKAGYGPCTNAYDGCNRSPQVEKIDYTCPNCASPDSLGGCSAGNGFNNSGPKVLSINNTWSGTDRQTARILGFQYINNANNSWSFAKSLT